MKELFYTLGVFVFAEILLTLPTVVCHILTH